MLAGLGGSKRREKHAVLGRDSKTFSIMGVNWPCVLCLKQILTENGTAGNNTWSEDEVISEDLLTWKYGYLIV